MYFLVYDYLFSGGSETFLLREARYLNSIKQKTSLICKSIIPYMRDEFNKANTNIELYNNVIPNSILKKISSGDIVIVIELKNYYLIKQYCIKNSINAGVYLYTTHPHYFTEWLYRKKFDKIIKSLMEKSLLKDIQNGHVFFMDEETRDSTLSFYGFTNVDDAVVKRLPIVNEKCTINRERNSGDSIVLLTIARAEFPFKGYIIGLLKQISESKYRNKIRLNIVSYGEQLQEIRDTVLMCNFNESAVVIYEGLEYDELIDVYKECDVYVGMGTTVLEAANYGAISIAVKSYTMECLSDELFFEEPSKVSAIGMKKTIQFIEEIIELDNEKFNVYRLKNKEAFEKNYDISLFNHYLISNNKISCNECVNREPLLSRYLIARDFLDQCIIKVKKYLTR